MQSFNHTVASALLLIWSFALPAHANDLNQPRPGLFTGGPPSTGQLDQLAGEGVHTVIDLRPVDEGNAAEQETLATARGLRFHRLPVAGAGDLTPANAAALKQLLDQSGDGVLLHCASGNRVGALLALMAVQEEGASAEHALQLGRAAGLKSLEPVIARQLQPEAADRQDCTGVAC